MSTVEYETYKRLRILGEGSYGKAWLCQSSFDESFCVIKELDLNLMSETEKREATKEAKILEVLDHPNIIRFREVFETKRGKLCIVMDYADGKQRNMGLILRHTQVVTFRRRSSRLK